MDSHEGCAYEYSERYYTTTHEYRHVMCKRESTAHVIKGRRLKEVEWRAMGIQMSRGWEHYLSFEPVDAGCTVMLAFRRPIRMSCRNNEEWVQRQRNVSNGVFHASAWT